MDRARPLASSSPARATRPSLPLLVGLFLLAGSAALHPALAFRFVVGDGHPYPTIGSVPWESLAPGDTVLIHHRTADYHEKWVLGRAGTQAQPIVVRGVPSPEGLLPVINGIDATTRPQLNFWNENRGIIKIGGANNPPDTMPAWLIIENLDIRSGRTPYTFTGRNGLTAYASNCAAIYIEKGEHVVIRGCRFRDCGNGFFCAHLTTDLVVEHCTIEENGIEGSIYEHNNYTEAFGVLFQFNHFGPLRAGCNGNNLKDRSAGTIIRYNWIESGNRQLDLVDSDYPELYNDPSYRRTYVYGNILVEPDGAGNSQIAHYGGDSGLEEQYRQGTLYFHHNTLVSTRTGNTTLVRLSSSNEHCDARNNVLYVTAAGSRLAILSESGGVIDLWSNWLKPGWVVCHGSTTGQVVNHGNVEGSSPGFVNEGGQDFGLTSASACIDAGGPLPAEILPEHLPVMEYVRHALSRPRPTDGTLDIGAFEYADTQSADDGTNDDDAGDGGTGGWLTAAIRVYPNPCTNGAMIETRSPGRIVVTSADGRVWLDAAVADQDGAHRTWWDASRVPAGVYFVRWEPADNTDRTEEDVRDPGWPRARVVRIRGW